MEVALKLAYQFARRTGPSQKPRFLSLQGAYHGDTVGATSLVRHMAMGSRDGGLTWSAPIQLSQGTSSGVINDRALGEYDEIVALPLDVRQPAFPNPPAAQNDLGPGGSGHDPRLWPGAFYHSFSDGTNNFAAGYTPP